MDATAIRRLSVRLAVLIAALVVAFLLIGGPADADAPVPTVEYVVGSGDTLWSIAGDYVTPGADIRELITDIRDASGMTTSIIHPGQVLLIPSD